MKSEKIIKTLRNGKIEKYYQEIDGDGDSRLVLVVENA